jgi:hypothetical protein
MEYTFHESSLYYFAHPVDLEVHLLHIGRTHTYKGVYKSFRTGHMERELQMIELSATRCSCIAILWVSLVSFVAITLCVASQRVFIVVDFVINSVRKLLDTASYEGYGGKTHQIGSQYSDITVPSCRKLYHLQFSLQADSPENFRYTFVCTFVDAQLLHPIELNKMFCSCFVKYLPHWKLFQTVVVDLFKGFCTMSRYWENR